ncbi:LysM peptidoglycan-binding domain-containing M23 family metallopeptidase [Streptomyces sp. HNM0645]|uniref:M23 family metallopeptidase n=1 Tax=Streptomyces sp. HNM0645 TaxID=2782343 RepID=UPI0024B7A4ED|nr:LysM peptidoglycan-binding domain-containing M23 family metallopeptidase [Streptomyces sp. HNM0645]MDI9885583.1 LysM peptidoglycan-binding domain-containing M23 family metallopeptidase [Streptomyces sp. HNM0645]
MPGKGKHRRPRTSPFRRGFVAAGTGGAAIAIPLIGAAGANAAGQSAPAAGHAAPTVHKAVVPQAPQAGKAAKAYTVVAGDHLSKIAAEQDVAGGWKKLYADNRAAVGENPSLIHPGLKLSLHAGPKAAAGAKPQVKAERKADAPAKAKAEAEKPAASAERASRTADRGASAPAAAPVQAPAAAVANIPSGYFAPVVGGVSTAYKTAGALWSSGYHTGVDFIAPTGTSVKAVGPGTVVSAGWSGAYGNEVVIKHHDGTYSQYAHLARLSVSSGESVTGGQQIGLSGSTGNSTGPHLHFEIRTSPGYGSDIDPLAYLRQHGVTI